MGKYINEIAEYLKKENFDIIHLQEVTGSFESFEKIDCFSEIQKIVGNEMSSEIISPLKIKDREDSYFGNATFFRSTFDVVECEILWLKPYKEIEKYDNRRIEDDPRAVLDLKLDIGGTHVNFLNTHLAWSPTAEDTDEKVGQGNILVQYVKNITGPFVLSGDFNVTPNSKIVKGLDKVGINLTTKNNVLNTLNPRKHKASHLFPPGIAVDYIYTSKDIKTEKFEVLEDFDLSDHLGLAVELDI